jgi:hypothetical protein
MAIPAFAASLALFIHRTSDGGDTDHSADRGIAVAQAAEISADDSNTEHGDGIIRIAGGHERLMETN